jgi:FkbM family methyltransferase
MYCNRKSFKGFSNSQAGQECWVAEKCDFKRNGFFVDIGASDGLYLSNTYALEKKLGWKGICIEADRIRYKDLCTNRTSTNVCLATRNYKGYCSFNRDTLDGFVEIASQTGNTKCDTLDNILIDNNSPKKIDYVSVDIEGLEYEVLLSFNFLNWDIKLLTIEHNLYLNGPIEKKKIYDLMIKSGFERVKENVLAPTKDGMVPFEDWFKKID